MIADDEHDTARTGGFDPRYDPAFQRGYRPQPGEPTRMRATAPDARSSAEPGRAVPRPVEPGRAEPGRAPSASTGRSRDRLRPPAPADAHRIEEEEPTDRARSADAVVTAEPATEPAAPAARPRILGSVDLSPRRNPLMLAVWIVGAALVVVGVALYAVAVGSSYTTTYSGSTQDVGAQVLTQIGWVLAGPMITVGLTTLVALLLLTALAARSR
jgi:hypothetical protein